MAKDIFNEDKKSTSVKENVNTGTLTADSSKTPPKVTLVQKENAKYLSKLTPEIKDITKQGQGAPLGTYQGTYQGTYPKKEINMTNKHADILGMLNDHFRKVAGDSIETPLDKESTSSDSDKRTDGAGEVTTTVTDAMIRKLIADEAPYADIDGDTTDAQTTLHNKRVTATQVVDQVLNKTGGISNFLKKNWKGMLSTGASLGASYGIAKLLGEPMDENDFAEALRELNINEANIRKLRDTLNNVLGGTEDYSAAYSEIENQYELLKQQKASDIEAQRALNFTISGMYANQNMGIDAQVVDQVLNKTGGISNFLKKNWKGMLSTGASLGASYGIAKLLGEPMDENDFAEALRELNINEANIRKLRDTLNNVLGGTEDYSAAYSEIENQYELLKQQKASDIEAQRALNINIAGTDSNQNMGMNAPMPLGPATGPQDGTGPMASMGANLQSLGSNGRGREITAEELLELLEAGGVDISGLR